MPDSTPLSDLIHEYRREADADLVLFSGSINDFTADRLADVIGDRSDRATNVTLILTTHGGDPHAAYRVIRTLRGAYASIRVLVAGRCKSAGTLMAIGADTVAFGPCGELGPLDAQMARPDELAFRNSDLDITRALAVVLDHANGAFLENLSALAPLISTKLAAEIAVNLTAHLFAPISGQIDPLRLAEAQRASQIAIAYAERLGTSNLKAGAVETLTQKYPAHGFVIDRSEAESLFHVAEELTSTEKLIADNLQRNYAIIRSPADKPRIWDLGKLFPKEEEEEDESDEPNALGGGEGNDEATHQGEPGNTGESDHAVGADAPEGTAAPVNGAVPAGS